MNSLEEHGLGVNPEYIPIDDYEMQCRTCKQQKHAEMFPYKNKNRPIMGRKNQCFYCRQSYDKVLKRIKKVWGSPPADYHCPGCNLNEDELKEKQYGGPGKKRTVWVFEHDHETEEFRGWVCWDCNALLGFSRESIKTLMNMAQFLRTGGSVPRVGPNKVMKGL